jgi:molybdopterin adenylyltransferase
MEITQRLKVISVNISEKKGTIKIPVKTIEINETGIAGDAHAGPWHRQVSLLGTESIEKGSVIAGRDLAPGLFAENITTEGFPIYKMNYLDILKSGSITLQVTQIGKKCHSGCDIFKEIGDCVMPKEGIFARVISGGILKAGDEMEYHPKVYKAMLITLSDRASKGIYEDKSGALLRQVLSDFYTGLDRPITFTTRLIPDEAIILKENILEASNNGYDFIFTTGGTGIGPRDITPDVVKQLINKEIPGIMEFIRMKYGTQFPSALISRSIAGTIGNSLIFTLPGSPKAVKEYLDEILKSLEHCVRMINGIDKH